YLILDASVTVFPTKFRNIRFLKLIKFKKYRNFYRLLASAMLCGGIVDFVFIPKSAYKEFSRDADADDEDADDEDADADDEGGSVEDWFNGEMEDDAERSFVKSLLSIERPSESPSEKMEVLDDKHRDTVFFLGHECLSSKTSVDFSKISVIQAVNEELFMILKGKKEAALDESGDLQFDFSGKKYEVSVFDCGDSYRGYVYEFTDEGLRKDFIELSGESIKVLLDCHSEKLKSCGLFKRVLS
ncbi:hypothetical protein ACFLY6_01200, partial [Candidatus Dependentiae bacterium]